MNVAVAWYLASVPRMLGTPSAFAPASNVSATTLEFWEEAAVPCAPDGCDRA
jgi:hypothetical protein